MMHEARNRGLLILSCFMFLASCFFPPSVDGAESLKLITSLDPLEAEEYVSAFEKGTGIKVQWIRLSAGEALARLRSEAENPTQDVWFGAPATEFVAAKKAGILEKYIPKNSSWMKDEWRDEDDFWTGVYFGFIVFISGADKNAPSSWQELLNPEFKGEVVVSYPYTAGTGYTIYAGLISLFGEDEALSYYEKLDDQIRRYTKSGSTPIVEVGLGEANIGIVFDQDALRKGVSRGFPIKITYPSDGIPFEIGGAALIRGGNSDLGEKFIDWVISSNAQNLMNKWYRIPIHPGAKINDISKKPSELNLVKMDFEKIGGDRERLIKRWREKVGK